MNTGISPVFPAKLRAPNLKGYLRRDRLYEMLDGVRESLVVVQAGAGYGKTTLVASYLQDRERQAIWYHLGATDRIPGTLMSHIGHAVAELLPADVISPDPVAAPDDPEMEGAALAARLGRVGSPLVLVLEEYNRLDESSEIHLIVQALVEHLPSHVQVFLLTRSRPPLPLARMGIAGLSRILTADDLAFNLEETAALFSRTYNHYLTLQELALVQERLEGWAAGLHLTYEALKVTTQGELTDFWSRFTGTSELFDYLAEEVIGALPPTTVEFLYQTSIFTMLQPDLIEEFLPGCRAASMLTKLARDNLFTIALGSTGIHYRYHSLFRQLLFKKLQENAGEEGVRKLHIKAAELYAQRDEVDYAIGHSLAARDYQLVRSLLERLVNHHRADVALRLMEGWLERVFPNLEGVGEMALRRVMPISAYELVLPGLRKLAEDSSPDVDAITQAHAQVRLGTYLYYPGQLDEAIMWMDRARFTLHAVGQLIAASVCSGQVAIARILKGVPEQAEGAVADALAWAGNNAFESSHALWAKGELDLAFGRFQEAEEAARAALARDAPFRVGSAFEYSVLGVALLGQGRIEEAKAACTAALSHTREYGVPTDHGFACVRMAMALLASGDLSEAQAAAENAVAVSEGLDGIHARALLVRAEVAAVAGDPEAPRLWNETQAFWKTRGYQMHRGYDGLIAPTLISKANQPHTTGAGSGKTTGRAIVSPARESTSLDGNVSLVIRTLGSFLLQIQGRECDHHKWGRAPSVRLLLYLLVNRNRLVPRDQLLEALWPGDDPGASAKRLSVALHVLRRQLTPHSNLVDRQGQVYFLRLPETANLDLDQYLELAESGLKWGDQAMLQQAAGLYQGDFLAEFPFDDFLEAERIRLRDLHRQVVTTLAKMAQDAGKLDAALAWVREAQRLDPLLEEPVQQTMEILLARGEPGAAADAYRQLHAHLRRELGVEPTERMQRLYHKALAYSK